MDKTIAHNIIGSELENIIQELHTHGKFSVEELTRLSDYLNNTGTMLKKHIEDSPNKIYDLIIEDYLKNVEGISKLFPGFSAAIKDGKSGIILETYSGKTSEDGELVDSRTRFDFASITKMFTALEELKLIQEGKFDNKREIKQYKDGKYKLSIPVSELERFTTRLITDRRIDEDITKEEFERRLTTLTIDYDTIYEYNDIPYIILKDLLPTDEEYFEKYYKEEMKLLNTSYEKYGSMTGGSPLDISSPFDKKARNMLKFGYKEPGHAGIFGTSRDLVKVYDGLKSGFISDDKVKELIRRGIPQADAIISNGKEIKLNKAMGVNIKLPDGLKRSEVIPILSENAFTAVGSSGGYSTYDLDNDLTANFLSNVNSRKEAKMLNIDELNLDSSEREKLFDNGTIIKLFNRQFEIFDSNGNPVKEKKDGIIILDSEGREENKKVSYTTITNTFKYMQIYTLLALRLANKVLYKYSQLNDNYYSENELNNSSLGNNTRTVKHL